MKRIFTILLVLTTISLSAQTIADFESFNLDPESFLNGSDGSGGFSDGNVFLPNNFVGGFWSGWIVSNSTDSLTPGYNNDFSAITGSGVDGSSNYAISFSIPPNVMHLENDAIGEVVEGMYITNATYSYLSMRDGDSFAKKFGGATGDEPDYFLLTVKGYLDGNLTSDSVNFYLADFRFDDNSMDYIIDEWTYVDLTALGKVDSLSFALSSTDVGMFGMNTPSYFCVDNVITSDGVVGVGNLAAETFEIYPNPTTDRIILNHLKSNNSEVRIFDMQGRLLLSRVIAGGQQDIDLTHFQRGTYLFQVLNEKGVASQLLVKK